MIWRQGDHNCSNICFADMAHGVLGLVVIVKNSQVTEALLWCTQMTIKFPPMAMCIKVLLCLVRLEELFQANFALESRQLLVSINVHFIAISCHCSSTKFTRFK